MKIDAKYNIKKKNEWIGRRIQPRKSAKAKSKKV